MRKFIPFDPEKAEMIEAAQARQAQVASDQALEAAPIPRPWYLPGERPTDNQHNWAGKKMALEDGRMPDGSHFTIGTGEPETPQTPQV